MSSEGDIERKVKELVRIAFASGLEAGKLSCGVGVTAQDSVAMSDLVGRLKAACNGHPAAKIPWPHRLLHEAADTIEALSAEIERLKARLSWTERSWASTGQALEKAQAALFRYGQHEPDCRHGDLRPDAECTCGLEAAING